MFVWCELLYAVVLFSLIKGDFNLFFQLGAMVFKQAVFETRKKTKTMFRVKAKGNLKDIQFNVKLSIYSLLLFLNFNLLY